MSKLSGRSLKMVEAFSENLNFNSAFKKNMQSVSHPKKAFSYKQEIYKLHNLQHFWISNPKISMKILSNHWVVMLKKPFANPCVIIYLENLVKSRSAHTDKTSFKPMRDLFMTIALWFDEILICKDFQWIPESLRQFSLNHTVGTLCTVLGRVMRTRNYTIHFVLAHCGELCNL